jgi:hypothetical protein
MPQSGFHAQREWFITLISPFSGGACCRNKTESMVTPVFATPILTTSWLA